MFKTINKLKILNVFAAIRTLLYITLFTLFIVIPTNKISSFSLCAIYKYTHFVCSTCGVTRAFSNFMHGNFAVAFQYNEVFTLVILPISIIIFLDDTITFILRTFGKREKFSLLETVVIRSFK